MICFNLCDTSTSISGRRDFVPPLPEAKKGQIMKKGIAALILLGAMLLETGCGERAVIDTGESALPAVNSVETVAESREAVESSEEPSSETVEYSEDPIAQADYFGEIAEEELAEAAKPETTAEPGVTAKPEATVKTETTANPEATAKPEATVKPEATAEPEVTAKPEMTVKPEVTAEPEATAEPEVTAKPEATAEPNATAKPEVTAEPNATAEPVAPTEEPGNIVPSDENSSTGAVQLPEDSFF